MEKLLDVFIQDRKLACKNCICNADFSDPCSICYLNKWGPKMCHESFIVPEPKQDSEKNKNFPSSVEMTKSFLKSTSQELKAIIDGHPRLSRNESSERYKICGSCEFFEKEKKRCLKCGCYMPIKTSWRSQKCPIGKW
jgi:hypothetical protein